MQGLFPPLRRRSLEPSSGFAPSTSIAATGPYIQDRVKETTTTTGTDTLSLNGVGTFNGDSFVTAVGSGNSCLYEIVHQTLNERETGMGTVTAGVGGAPDTLTRDPAKVTKSSNAGALVNFSAGTKDVFITIPAVIVSPTNTTYNVKAFGAKGDVQTVTDGTMTSGSAILTSASGLFAAADVGKPISVKGPGAQGNNAGPANYFIGNIASYQSPTQVALSGNATTTLSGCEVYWGTDDAPAINAAMLAASVKGGIVLLPPGIYFIGSAVIIYSHVHIQGSGIDTSILMLKPGAACDILLTKDFEILTGTNQRGGPYSFSIKDLSINGWYYHGGYRHTQINAAATRYDTTLTVLDTSGFPSSGKLLVYDNLLNQPGELISYGSKTATTFSVNNRAQENTIAQAFQGGESVDLRSTGGVFQSGLGLRIYGYGYVLERLRIHDCEQDGFYSEFTTLTGTVNPDDMMAHIKDMIVHTNNGHGIWWQGPHDSSLIDMQVYSNSMNGVRIGPLGVSGTRIGYCHSFGNQNWSYSLEGFCLLYNCVGEQGIAGQVYVNTSQTQVIACHFFANSAAIFTRGVVMAGGSYCVIDAVILDCNQGTVDFTGDGGNNYYRLQIRQQAGGNVFIGAPASTSNMTVTELPGNVNALTGQNTQIAAPALFASRQTGTATVTFRAPILQTSNILSLENAAAGSTVLSVFDKNGMLGIRQATPTFGLHQVGSSLRLAALGTPTTPTGAAFGGSGTNADYFIVAEDAAGFKTLASAKVTISGGAALSATVWNRVTFTAQAGAVKYYILKTNTATQIATVSPSIGGVVTLVTVGAAGSGYTGGAPPIGFNGPPQCGPQATATVASSLLNGITINTGQFGSGFTSVPTVVIGGPGNGAAATAVMGVSNLSSIGAGGSGYAINDTITLTGGTFTTAAVLKVTAVSGGAVTAVAIQTMGNYSVLPANPVAQGSTTGQGTAGTFNVLWGISAVTVTNGGTGYSSAPSIGFNGGGLYPTCGVVLAANAVSGISVSGGAASLTGAPTVVVGGVAAGSGATATSSLSSTSYDDIGGGTSAFTTTLRDATADATFDGNVVHTAAAAIAVGTMGTTTTAVSSTTTAETKSLIGTIVGTFTCPANFMIVGRKLRFCGHGNITTGATASTIDFQIFFAGTKIASTTALAPTISQTNKYFEWDIEIECVTVGATGTLFCQGKVLMMNAAAPAAPILWPLLGNNATPPAAVTVDTTASSLMDFKTVTGNNLHTITNNPGTSLEVMN